ncbi:MAG: hypothetical protein IPG81_05965 [Sandaracinaceae bacterium]|nr:hypothetical protein [Sandaracinaceae bacterium]MBK7154406.1 hypothetical protein [Sandaracinaceae bacterium]
MFRHDSLAAHRPTPRSFHRVLIALALCTGLFTSACGGGSTEGGEGTAGGEETSAIQTAEVPLDQSAPQGETVAVLFTAAALTGPDEEIPRNSVGVMLTDETGTTVEVALVDLTGTCGAVEAAAGGFASFQCWWAGGGTKLHARAENGELVIYREELEEESPEDPTEAVAIHRFALAAGANVVAAPTDSPL